MTDQHPLTDDLCCQVWQDNKDSWLMWQEPCPPIRRTMRAVADWQLKQATKWLKSNTADYVGAGCYFLTESFLDDFKKAMRPQEDN